MTTPQPLNLYINEARSVALNPLIAVPRRAAAGTAPVLTAGDFDIPVFLGFYEPDPESAILLNVRHDGDTILLVGKAVREDDAPILFMVALATESQDARDDYLYGGVLSLNNAPILEAVQKDGIAIWVDVVINGKATHQFPMALRPQGYAGTEIPPDSAEAGFFEELVEQALAAAAAADASRVAAAASESAAASSESNAAASASSAADQAASAGDSASSAAASESAAASSAASAASNASAAHTFATAASASATAAQTAKTQAETARDVTEAYRDEVVSAAAGFGILPKGGVALAGDIGAGSGFGYPVSGFNATGDLCVGFLVRPAWDDGRKQFLFATSTHALSFGQWNNTANAELSVLTGGTYYTIATGQTRAALLGKDCFVFFVRISGVWYGSFNGSTLTAFPTHPADTSDITRLLGGLGGFGQFQGLATPLPWFNRAPSGAEIAQFMKGEMPAALALRGGFMPPIGNQTVSYGTPSGASSTGVTLTGTNLGFPAYVYSGANPAAVPRSKVRVGDVVRVRYTLPIVGGVVHRPIVWNNGAFGTGMSAFTAPVNDGGNKWHADCIITHEATEPDGTFSPAISLDNWSGSQSFVFSNISYEILGTVEDFPADKVSAVGTWRGRFGTLLVPSAGITPLKPEPVQIRTEVITYDLSAPAAIRTPYGWSAPSRNSTGVCRIPVPSYVAQGLISATPAVHAASRLAHTTPDAANSRVDTTVIDLSGTVQNVSKVTTEIEWLE